jgi:hypothetical protein
MRRNILIIFFSFIIFCSGGDRLSGTSNETQTGKPAALVGLIVYSDSARVNGADVILHDQNAVKKIVLPLGKRSILIRSGQTKTNINGFFRFDSVDTGRYYVEVNDHDTLGALLEATVHDTDTLVQVNGVLKRTGTIQGNLDTGLTGKTDTTYVYVIEIQKLVVVDSTGKFEINNLPPYNNYTLRVLHDTVVVQSRLDTMSVQVTAGDTIHIGNYPPQVLLGVDTAAGVAPCTVKVIYKVTDPEGNALAMRLDYGDGNSETLTQTSGSRTHVFTDSGAFKIMLIADDGKGGLGKDSTVIKVFTDNPPPQNVSLRGVAWSGNQFVAVATGSGGKILTSADGISWRWRSSGTTNDLLGIVWGGNQFVAFDGLGSILKSSDGISWSSQTISSQVMYDITWGDSQFITCGGYGAVCRSSDGNIWTSSAPWVNSLLGITWGNNKFVTMDRWGASLTSPNGIVWSSSSFPQTPNNIMLCHVKWGNDKFAAVSAAGMIVTSPDGATWTMRTSNTSNTLNGLTWGNNQFVAVGTVGTIVTSPDGITWTIRTSHTSITLYGIIWQNNQFMAVGDSETMLTSPDGVTWSIKPLP